MHSHVMPDCVTPWTAARQAPCPWEAQASMLESLPYPPPGDLPDPGAKLASPAAPGLHVEACRWGSGEALICRVYIYTHSSALSHILGARQPVCLSLSLPSVSACLLHELSHVTSGSSVSLVFSTLFPLPADLRGVCRLLLCFFWEFPLCISLLSVSCTDLGVRIVERIETLESYLDLNPSFSLS